MSANVSDDANAVGGFESDGSLDLDSMEQQQQVNADLVVEEPEWPEEVTNERKCFHSAVARAALCRVGRTMPPCPCAGTASLPSARCCLASVAVLLVNERERE